AVRGDAACGAAAAVHSGACGAMGGGVAPPRPGLAQASKLTAAEDVQVEVRDGLAALLAAVHDEAGALFREALVGGHAGGDDDHAAEPVSVILGESRGGNGAFAAWNHEQVGGGLRADVADDDERVVLVEAFA